MEQLELYLKTIGASDEVMSWLQTAGKKALQSQKVTVDQLEHIIDYLVTAQNAPSRLRKLSIKDALRKAGEWSKSRQKKGANLVDGPLDIESVLTFDDGTSIVKLKTQKAYEREGHHMSHCVGGYDPANGDYDIYSYRDKKNNPHATFEVRKNSEQITQIKGKGNGAIHPKYINPILAFFEYLKMDIRPKDMTNLGYYHLDKTHLPFLKKFNVSKSTLVEVRGEYYGVSR